MAMMWMLLLVPGPLFLSRSSPYPYPSPGSSAFCPAQMSLLAGDASQRLNLEKFNFAIKDVR